MQSTTIDEAFRIVFRYLNDTELDIAAKVSRSWNMMAKNENLLRGPICVLKSKVRTDVPDSWLIEREDIINHYDCRSCLQIFFTNDTRNPKSNDCHCSLLTSNCYSLLLESDLLINVTNENVLCSLFFPKTCRTKIATFTFIKQLFIAGLFCQEIRFNCGNDMREVKFLKYKLQPFFANDGFTHTCLIVFCKTYGIVKFLDFIQVLSEWFPQNKIHGVWGGIIESLSVCQDVYNKTFCSIDSEYSLILINSPFMEVWTELLDDKCNSDITIKEKLSMLKERIRLKSHSVALMHINTPRLAKFYALDISIFRETFPDLCLFPIYGKAVLHGNSFSDFTENFMKRTSDSEAANTSIMIIAYS